MKRLLCLTAGFALVATAAFGQILPGFEPMPGTTEGAQVYFKDTGGTDAESLGLSDLITRALDRSRSLHLVAAVLDEKTIEVHAPVSLVKEDNRRVIVTYEVTLPRGGTSRSYKTTCTSTQLDRCAEDIARRVERLANETKLEIPGMPIN